MPALHSRLIQHPQKKALVIGIGYTQSTDEGGTSDDRLLGPHKDARKFVKLLIDKYSYDEANIVLMLDHDGIDDMLIPTKTNIIAQMRKLVTGARDGDQFVFFFSGHSMEITETATLENQGFDDVVPGLVNRVARRGLMASSSLSLGSETNDSDCVVTDVLLRKILVGGIPPSARLVSVFDCCRSGTMLATRRTAIINLTSHTDLKKMTNNGHGFDPSGHIRPVIRWLDGEIFDHVLHPIDDNVTGRQYWDLSPTVSVDKCQCDGNCRPCNICDIDVPEIYSLSACADTQMTFESPDGEYGFTQSLVGLLSHEPHPFMSNLIRHLSDWQFRASVYARESRREQVQRADDNNNQLEIWDHSVPVSIPMESTCNPSNMQMIL
ncbi:hypothetical protein CERSUDRAFT_99634 [Gelatoporia subvermispora B]|uniref:Peptidase C14 caspase domain-containing protein n=1 Tax=Ceriporiopsis subvermispora (strain B) TaxID=914234 RepID=M2QJE3_CERS8|nr:hypothetical protein CERSUDRAFT_99634 [Gelatoporia subvermispora B]